VYESRVHDRIADINAADWDRLAGLRYPFLRHAFLLAAEESGSVCAGTGWRPAHLTLQDEDGRPVGAMPLYEKDHSWGEFVFDWGWAEGYRRAGLDYYPKLVSAVPFTPAQSSRLLTGDIFRPDIARHLLEAATGLATSRQLSSVHVLFPTPAETSVMQDFGMALRKDCQFHWSNRGYGSFDEFLDTFTAAKRKKTRRERRRIVEAGIRFRAIPGNELDAGRWERVYELISMTFVRRGSMPYFSLDFFLSISKSLPDNILVIVGEDGDDIVSTAVFFRAKDSLYGRYWGSSRYVSGLHFETCYYQGIEYCIANGLQSFEPGTQGEHKVARGFEPVATCSAHWLAHAGFNAAVAEFVDEEGRHVDRYIGDIQDRTPFRRNPS
jgi:predicted N-acyltransferase